MSVTAISSDNTIHASALQAKYRQLVQDFKNLGDSLQPGDLASAQKAFAALQMHMPYPRPVVPGHLGQSDPLGNDLNSLASALQAADLSSARKAYASLMEHMQLIEQGHRRQQARQGGNDSTTSGMDVIAGASQRSSGSGVRVLA